MGTMYPTQPAAHGGHYAVGKVQEGEAPPCEGTQKDARPEEGASRNANHAGTEVPEQEAGGKGRDTEHEDRGEESDVHAGDARAVVRGERLPKDAPSVQGTEPYLHDDRGDGDRPKVHDAHTRPATTITSARISVRRTSFTLRS